MDDRILINPENRLLGTSGSNDFSLYGAQPDPALTVGPAPPTEAPEDASQGNTGPDPLQTQPPATDAPDPVQSMGSAAPVAPDPAAAPVGAFQATTLMPAASAESGGSITPILPATSLAGFDANGLTAPSLAGLSSDSSSPNSTTVPADPARVFQDLDAPSSAAGSSPDSTTVVTTPAPILQDLDAPASAAVAPIAASVSPLAEALPLDSVGQVVPGLVAEIVPADPLAPVVDGVQDLLGADPAGGIATLVSLVSISDVLDLGAVVAEDAEPVADPATDLIDTLAMDATGELAPPALDEGEDEGADTLLALPLPPPEDILDDGLGL